ncbi:MAG: LLM class F420-dependent oxidoreductase [Actinomycetia bacterium]|nr:LLM class F420-dependent oxidoreductase [Actinomycetes bacterium]
MKFGIMFASTGHYAEPEAAAAIGVAAEDFGLESIWSIEHVVIPDGYQSQYPYHESGKIPGGESWNMPDPLLWLTYVAALTSRITLATGIVILPQRNPLVLAKECATLDRLSQGRFELGIGVGWLEEEFNALGVPFARRGARTDDYIGAMRALWAADPASYHGEFVNFDDAISLPRPDRGRVPVIVGGHSNAAAVRAGRLGDGFFPANADTNDLIRLRDVMRAAAVDHGRDPDAIEMTGGTWSPSRGELDEVRRLEDEGISRLIVAPPTSNPDGVRDAMEQLAERIAPVSD